MITVALTALITVIFIALLLKPLMTGKHRKPLHSFLLVSFIALPAMGIYLWQGSPGMPSAPALFEKEGPHFERRRLETKEMELMRKLAANPDDIGTMLSLGAVRLENGRIEEAISVLTIAYEKDPEGIMPVRLKLGAAHYAAAIAGIMLQKEPQDIMAHFKKALEIAPKDAPYRERLLQDLKNLQEAGE